jgi:hypothetical protein
MLIIKKELNELDEFAEQEYDVIDIIEAIDADGNTVNIKRYRQTVTESQMVNNINRLQIELSEVTNELQNEIDDNQSILDEINGMEISKELVVDNQLISESKELTNGLIKDDQDGTGSIGLPTNKVIDPDTK